MLAGDALEHDEQSEVRGEGRGELGPEVDGHAEILVHDETGDDEGAQMLEARDEREESVCAEVGDCEVDLLQAGAVVGDGVEE